jgi:hypothetical protein
MRFLAISLLAMLLVAGCLGTTPVDPASDGPTTDLAAPEWKNGALELDVPVPVLLIGFTPEAGSALREALADGERVEQATSTLNQQIPPDPATLPDSAMPLSGRTIPMPIVPTARYDVRAVPTTLEEDLRAELPSWADAGVHEAGRLEAFLARGLAGTDLEPDANAPTLVLMDGHAFGDPTWRYTFPHGYLEPVSAFGELEPIHIIDLAGFGLDASHVESVKAEIAELVRTVTQYRFLQGSVYPLPIAECHAITLIMAWRPTALGEHLPMLESSLELYDPDELARGFMNLTGTTTYVDSKVLMLPVDDPVLDLIARGEFGTLEAQRAWFAENWEDYWVAHDGCEAYLSFVIHGDAASAPSGIIGIGTYDPGRGYRISVSWVNEALRLLFDPASPVNQFGQESGRYNWINFLLAHETGHILGMHHPFHLLRADGSVGQNNAFQDVWSAMSYSTDGRVIDFGVIDQANFQRNRFGFLVHMAHELGLETDPAYTEALALAAEFRWNDASAVLWPVVEPAAARVGGSIGPYPPTDAPWFGERLALPLGHVHAHHH